MKTENPENSPSFLKKLSYIAFLGLFFLVSYTFTNSFAASLPSVPSIWFSWERSIPLIPWTIIPYWSIDLLYGLSLLLASTNRELRIQGLRLFTAQIVSVSCFLLFPLSFAFERPKLEGSFGFLFDLLMSFDKPFNQAPSLHISLLVIIWAFFLRKYNNRLLRVVIHLWCVLIGISVLTTWQHHFIDVPTGILAGFLCLWLWPFSGTSPLTKWKKPNSKSAKLALYYGSGSLILIMTPIFYDIKWFWLWWPSISLGMYALAYGGFGVDILQKGENGKSFAVFVLFLPLEIGLWVNSRLWTLKTRSPELIHDSIYLGRMPNYLTFNGVLIDLTAELSKPLKPKDYKCIPCLDLIVPHEDILHSAVKCIKEAKKDSTPILVSCALGYSRSAMVVCGYLVYSGSCDSVSEAIDFVKKRCPWIVLNSEHKKVLEAFKLKIDSPSFK